MTDVTRREKKSERWLIEKTGLRCMVKIVQEKMRKWTGHLVRTNVDCWFREILSWFH